MAASALESSLLKYSAKEHFFRCRCILLFLTLEFYCFQGLPLPPVHRCIECSACCCQVRFLMRNHHCTVVHPATHPLTFIQIRYEEQYPAFGDSREAKLIKVIVFAKESLSQIYQHLIYWERVDTCKKEWGLDMNRHYWRSASVKTNIYNLCVSFKWQLINIWNAIHAY